MRMPALTRLARFVATDALEADDATLAILRDGVIDTLGCIHAGVDTEVAVKARAAVASMGAPGPAAVIGTSMTTARPQAAFLNAVAGHALDFDDWEIPGNTHPSIVLVPAILAVSHEETSGAELATAYLAGFELIARLGEALNFDHYDAGWHSTATLGAVGAAAAAGRLKQLSCEAMSHALSLAISAAAGFTCQFGSHAKPVQAGFAARAGVEAACLADAGLKGQAHVLDHDRGFAAILGGVARERLDGMVDRLGQRLALTEHGLVLKPWPSCGYTHRIMTCALAMRRRVSIVQIAQIDLHLPDFHLRVLPFREPGARAEALFSPHYVAAMGLGRGALTLADIEAETWTAQDIAALVKRTEAHAFTPRHPELNYSEDDPDRFVVTLQDGQVLEERCAYPTGAPQQPMPEAQLLEKFESNTGPVSRDWLDRLCDWPRQDRLQSLFLEGAQLQ